MQMKDALQQSEVSAVEHLLFDRVKRESELEMAEREMEDAIVAESEQELDDAFLAESLLAYD